MNIHVVKKKQLKEVHVLLSFGEEELKLLSTPNVLSKASQLNANAMGLLTSKGKPTDLFRSIIATMLLGDDYRHQLSFSTFVADIPTPKRTITVSEGGNVNTPFDSDESTRS